MQHQSILLVDDDEEDYLIIKEALADLDAPQVLQYAIGGEKALSLLDRRYNEMHSLPQLIVLDLNMQVMDGLTTLRLLKSDPRFKEIPVLIYSTTIHPHVEEECLKIGAYGCIQKPCSLEDILRVGESLLAFCK